MRKVITIYNKNKQWFLYERGIMPVYGDAYYENTEELKDALTDYGIACNAFGGSGVYAINIRRK